MKRHIIFLVAWLCIGVQAFAQEVKTIEVTGKVVDANKEPLIGVNVTVENVPGLGAITDINGLYKIKTEPYVRLIFSYVGFQSQRILVKEQTIVNVTMKEAEESVLEEIVVTGTGAQRKISVTGAITSVDVDDLNHNSSSSLANALAGNVAGLFAQQTSGQPGSNESEFWIRGISTFGASNAALVLVDGFERSLNEISVEDIESFQVLKDASETAIYGSRGANGVILITTRRGKAGKINVNAKVETTYNTRTFTPEYVDGYTYATLLNEARITRNESPMYTDDELFNLQHGLDPDLLPNVDWKDVVLKDGAMSYRASLSLNGGGTNARYYVSASYVEEQGMYKNADVLKQDYNANANLRRWNYRMNTDIDITKTTLLKVGISGSLRFQNDAGKGSYVIWNSLTGYTPIATPVMFSNGRIPAVPDWVNDSRDNPWVAATQTGFRQNWQNKLQTNLTLEQDLGFVTKGLKFIGRFGFDTYNYNYINKRRDPERWSAERYRDSDGNIVFHRMNEEQKLSQSSGGSGDRSEYFEVVLNYSRGFKNHHVGATLKYNQESKLQTYNIGSDLKNSIPRRYQGWAGRVAYDWKYRYFINFNFGYTGSENFDKENRFGFFPAVSGAWNVAEEPFVKKHFPWINMFKIRYSWGKAGSSNTGDRFPYMYTIGNTTGYHWADYGSTNNYSGKTYTVMASPNIGWEVANKQDLGVDLSLFKDRFQVTVDYFHERRSGIMMRRDNIPLTVGLFDVKTSKANVGKVLSTGFDGNFAYRQRIGKVRVTMRGNFTFSRNEIEAYDEAYTEYQRDPVDLRGLIAEGYNVICLRTFSKIYGLAGLRIGYSYSSEEIAGYINRVREPFNVNSLAQVAALAALDDDDFVRLSRDVNDVYFAIKVTRHYEGFRRASESSFGQLLGDQFFTTVDSDNYYNDYSDTAVLPTLTGKDFDYYDVPTMGGYVAFVKQEVLDELAAGGVREVVVDINVNDGYFAGNTQLIGVAASGFGGLKLKELRVTLYQDVDETKPFYVFESDTFESSTGLAIDDIELTSAGRYESDVQVVANRFPVVLNPTESGEEVAA